MEPWSVNGTWMRCWGLLACVSCARTSASIRPRMTMPEHISPESSKFLTSEEWCVHWLDRALIRHWTYICKIYLNRGSSAYYCHQETSGLPMRRYRRDWVYPLAQITIIIQSVWCRRSPSLRLTGQTPIPGGTFVFQTWYLRLSWLK